MGLSCIKEPKAKQAGISTFLNKLEPVVVG